MALDYGAILSFAAARKADLDLLTDVLPAVQAVVLNAIELNQPNKGE